jgi:hypothetical protein
MATAPFIGRQRKGSLCGEEKRSVELQVTSMLRFSTGEWRGGTLFERGGGRS